MKKIYTKPSLLAEKFAVEDIMTGDIPTNESDIQSLFVTGGIGTISFTSFQKLEAINFGDFKSNN